MIQMKMSGYTERDRLNVLEGGINTYKKLRDKESRGIRPFFRNNLYDKETRKVNKQKKKNNWFKPQNEKTSYASVMFVDATPEDKLLKTFKDIEDKFRISDKERIKFVSKTGTKLSHLVQQRDPFNTLCKILTNKPCVEGQAADNFPSCRKMNINYSAQCNPCDLEGKRRVYIGETTRNIHVRSNEHFNAMRNKNTNSWMYKHIEKEHNGKTDEADFKWKVIGSFKKPMLRQLSEAIEIDNTEDEECLNLKSEYFSHKINRLEMVQEVKNKNKPLQCNYCSQAQTSFESLKQHIEDFHKRFKCKTCDHNTFGKKGLKYHENAYHSQTKQN